MAETAVEPTKGAVVSSEAVKLEALEAGDTSRVKPVGAFLRWKDITLQVPGRGGKNQGKMIKLLDGVTAHARPGAILGVMGSSGCGKSTLLDVLANRKEGQISGTIEFNGRSVFAKKSPDSPNESEIPQQAFLGEMGYVPQFDNFMANLSCIESLIYTARLVLPRNSTPAQLKKAAENALDRVGMLKIANNRIGRTTDQVRISGGQRRRLSVAQELLAKPKILFLDEPTSGLDSFSALAVMQTLRSLSDVDGMTIVLTVHQPRDEVFAMIDDLLLMKAGRIVYFGRANGVVEYFGKVGLPNERVQNPADFAIDIVCTNESLFDALEKIQRSQAETDQKKPDFKGEDSDEGKFLASQMSAADKATVIKVQRLMRGFLARLRLKREKMLRRKLGGFLVQKYASSELPVQMTEEARVLAEQYRGLEIKTTVVETESPAKKWLHWVTHEIVHGFQDCSILTLRTFRNYGREYRFHAMMFLRIVLIAIGVGFSFFNMPDYSEHANDRIALLVFLALIFISNQNSKMPFFYEKKALFAHELVNGHYGPFAFYVASFLYDAVTDVLIPVVLACILYPVSNMHSGADHFFTFLAAEALTCLIITGLLKAIACSMKMALHMIVMPVLIGAELLVSGFFLRKPSMNGFMLGLNYLSFFKYSFEILMNNELSGVEFDCKEKQLVFGPGGVTFEKCIPENGNAVLKTYDFVDVDFGLWFTIMILMVIGVFVLGYVLLKRQGRRLG
jgi:ABC-type multidrug transport system ATPase subunit/ABC-type multidrug transport system permease subunit